MSASVASDTAAYSGCSARLTAWTVPRIDDPTTNSRRSNASYTDSSVAVLFRVNSETATAGQYCA
jgi:hypothetical protein